MELCLFRYTEEFSSIFSTIEACSGMLRHALNEIYSGPRKSLSYSQPCPIPSPGSWRIGGILKPCETSPRSIQNPAIVRIVYSGIIQPYSGIFRALSNPFICSNLACWQFWNIQNSSITASRCMSRILSYLNVNPF